MVLEYLSHRPVNISTIEDPVEKNVPTVNQTQVNPVAGMTFENGLRALLRQDPDIIRVGETRDGETASDFCPRRDYRPYRALDPAHERRDFVHRATRGHGS